MSRSAALGAATSFRFAVRATRRRAVLDLFLRLLPVLAAVAAAQWAVAAIASRLAAFAASGAALVAAAAFTSAAAVALVLAWSARPTPAAAARRHDEPTDDGLFLTAVDRTPASATSSLLPLLEERAASRLAPRRPRDGRRPSAAWKILAVVLVVAAAPTFLPSRASPVVGARAAEALAALSDEGDAVLSAKARELAAATDRTEARRKADELWRLSALRRDADRRAAIERYVTALVENDSKRAAAAARELLNDVGAVDRATLTAAAAKLRRAAATAGARSSLLMGAATALESGDFGHGLDAGLGAAGEAAPVRGADSPTGVLREVLIDVYRGLGASPPRALADGGAGSTAAAEAARFEAGGGTAALDDADRALVGDYFRRAASRDRRPR